MTMVESTALISDRVGADLETLRVRDGVRAELFDYLHASPDCMVENLKAKGGVFRYCRKHKVMSAVVGEIGK